jgi:hypothetical protein
MHRFVLTRARIAVTVAVVVGVALVALPAAASGGGGTVLPPSARPHGQSLSDLARDVAQFTTSGNDPSYSPHTPLQVLYADPNTVAFTADGCGLDNTGSNALTVVPGKTLYVPMVNIDDSPPVLGVFPTTAAAAKTYMFDPSQVGTHDVSVTVDGTTTPIGPAYLAGPVTTPPLLDGGGTHINTIGAFLSPLTPGQHVVSFVGTISGALVESTYGVCFVHFDFTYTVDVSRSA